jgi:trimeric autotransporter adhesin
MANLTGTKIANTYKQLLQIGSNNNGISGTVQTVQDGSGTSSPLQLSNSAVNINGTFQLSGVTLTANASTLNAVADLTGATGIVAVSAGNVYGRTITGGTGVSITNGDGTEGNPTIALNTTGVVSGTYGPLTNLEINAVGQVVSATAVSTSVSVPTIRASEFIGGTFKGTTADFSSNTSIGGSIVVENTAVFNSTVSVSGTLTGSTATFTGTVSAGNISGANATFSGNVSATEYYGDGSNLTGIVAASATFATSAGFAASATNASFALSATNANFAASASFASSASYAASAGEASFAVSASSAAFATSADSATFAVSATNATTAYNVSGGIADISGLTAVSASISDLRAFQIGATSVSIGYLNVNAITAITISATDLKSSTLSFTSVSVSSLRVYRLAVETTLSATYGTFTGNVSAVSFYGDGSNLTGILVSIPTSVPSYTVNQLTIVSAATLAGVDLDTRINTVSVNTSVNAAAITSINTVISGLDYATSAELAATSAALATSISNSNTNITTNANAITSINTVINNLDYATSAELAAVSSTLATSIGNSNTNIAAVSALTSINAAAITSINTVVSNVSAVTSVNAAAITSINTILGDGSNFATSAELAATSAALATSISNHLPLSGGTLTGTVSGTDASFSGNVSASLFYGDGSNLTNLPSAPTSVSAYTVNQLTIVSAATLAGTDLETRINTVSVNTSVNSAAITSINTVINNLDYATSAELATVSSALATSIGNSNTNITTNTNAITSINTILGDGSNFATSAELAATSAALATSIATANTRITSVSDYAVALSATLATSISNSNTNIATVSALTSVNSAAITSINTVVANVSSTLATSIANHLPLAGGTLTGTVSGTDASFSGNVSASLFYGDGSNLTNLPSAPTSVTSFTVNQLTAVSTTSLMGITYPTTDGTSGQVLQTNGAGALTFVSVAGGGATDIDGLSDAITNSSGKTIGLGTGALVNDDGTTNNNTALGYNALTNATSGLDNVAVGHNAMSLLTTGRENTAVGQTSNYNL